MEEIQNQSINIFVGSEFLWLKRVESSPGSDLDRGNNVRGRIDGHTAKSLKNGARFKLIDARARNILNIIIS